MDLSCAIVVGYQEITTEAGMALITPSFKAVAGGYKLADIKVEGGEGIGDEYAQKINTNGTWGDSYWFLTEDGWGVPNGWYKDAFGEEPVSDEDTVSFGEGLSFSTGSDVTITYAGEVLAGSPTIEVAAGIAMVGNPTPMAVKMSSIIVDGGEGIGDEYAQKIKVNGTWGDSYWYLTEDGWGVPNGWYKDAFGEEPVTDDDVLAAAEAVSFSTGSDVTVTFPAIIIAQ